LAAERKQLDEKSPWWGEHLHRYYEAVKFLKGKEKILDIACGLGFGTDILAKNTEGGVVGGDIAEDAIKDSKQYWQRGNLTFALLDGTNLPYADNYFDTVVSFETIEHTTQYRQMLSEFSRVLKPNGIALISTPNFPINSPKGKVMNPYHTQEFTHAELSEILNEAFGEIYIQGQQYSRYKIKSFRNSIGWFFERFLLQRGIRKLPISLQDRVIQTLINRPIYPEAQDFEMVEGLEEVLKCQTFFAVCKVPRFITQ
jgi:2-polyprenyl-3-methyl-5-hydroxy-6-metoxy-1,4-benzoquinol methylase